MAIKEWPQDERPREKLLARGAKNLSDAELLAIFLRTGTRGKTAVDLARDLIMQFGSLKKLLTTAPVTLFETTGVGKAKYSALAAAVELGMRYQNEAIKIGQTLQSSQHAKSFLTQRLGAYAHEVFACLFLDSHQRVLAFEELFQGTINESNVYPREVVKRGLAHNAAKVILAHNHPSSRLTPSQADCDITNLLKQAMGLVGIQVIDHIIVGQNDALSLVECGKMP
jgi:DNA repair protein RadC